MHKKVLPLVILALLPFFVFLLIFNRRQTSLTRNLESTSPSFGNVPVNKVNLNPRQIQEVQRELDSVERLKRGTVIGFDEQNQIVDLLAVDVFSETNEKQTIQVDISSTSRFACWNTEQHGVAKNAFFPLQPSSYLSLNGEEVVNTINFSNQINTFAFFKISGVNSQGILKSEQIAVIDCN